MAEPEERGGLVAGGSGEAQAQDQPRDSAKAPMQPSLGPPKHEPRVFGLDKFNGDNFAEWSFKMENIFDHYDLLEVMEGMERRPENDPEKSLWVRKSAQGYLLLGQALGSSQIRHIKPFQREPEKGPKAWAALKGVHAPATAAVAVVLERQMAALRIEEDEAVEEGVQKFFDLLTRLEGADLNYSEPMATTTPSHIESRDDRFPGQFFFVSTQAPAGPEKDEGFEEPAAVGKVTLRSLDNWVIGSGTTYSMTPCADLLTELEPSLVKHVTSALGQRAEVKGMGKAMFKGADGKMVGLKNVLWVPNLTTNLISVRRLQKAGMDTSSKGAKTYTAMLGERILWDLHEDRDVYNEMWQIPVVPMPKERQVAASINTKGEAVGSGDGANGRAKEIGSKKCNLGGTSKLGEYKESGAAAQKQHKGEENPKAAAEEEYGENISEATAKAPLDEVVMDVVGSLKIGTAGAEYFLTIVDVYTRMTWVYVLSKKSDVAETVKTDWLPMVERQQDWLVKAIRTDRGGEFLSKEFSLWLKKNGIRHSLTMPYSPAMNGIAERANRTITETARGLLIEAGLPDYFWPDVVWSACVAKNRALNHVGADKWVPYVEWIGRKPKVDMLRVFGCMCMALVPKHLRHNKLGAKAIWAVHLGMAQNSKGWLLWDPFTKKLLVSRDNKFMENLMYKDWKAENEAKIGVRLGDVKSSGLEHVELPLELSSGSTTTRQSSLVNGGEEAKDAEEEEEEVQQVSEHAPTLMVGEDEEKTLKEALESSDAEEWKKAMESGLKSIEENGTWELVELPEGRKAITSKWLFKIKSDADGKIERYKSRLVAKGYQQKENVDYKELFAPVVKPTTLRTLLAGATIKGWVVKQMDVTTAFLNGILEEEIFMAQPEEFDDGSGRVWKLKKALYGLKQAPRQWYLKLREVLEEIGFTPSSTDHSLFMLGEGEQRNFMVVYVDDILIFSPSSDLVKEVMLKLQDKFKCKALGDVSFYLGLHIERDVEKRCMRVHQRKYLEALAANFGQSEGHVATPFPSGFKCVKGPEEESVGEEERRRFHSLVGSLMYAAVNTRPDVAFATGQLAMVVQCPNEEQVAAGMRVAKYLGQTPTVGVQYLAAAQRRQKDADGVELGRLFLTAFSDASYASEPEDMTSVGGFICCVGGGPTAWERKKQVDQALSSLESEYMALFRAVREIVWQRRLLAELGEEQQGPTPLYCDSQGAIALSKNPVLHGLTKHMKFRDPSWLGTVWDCSTSLYIGSWGVLHRASPLHQPVSLLGEVDNALDGGRGPADDRLDDEFDAGQAACEACMLWHEHHPELSKARGHHWAGPQFGVWRQLAVCLVRRRELAWHTFPNQGSDADDVLAVVHVDLCGPFQVAANDGSLYFLLLKDCKARYVWVRPVAKKLDALQEFVQWLAAVWVRNFLERSTLQTGTTPYQLLTGKKPDLSLARVWGCMAQFLVPEQQRGGKLKPKARWGLHVGVSEESKGWELLDITGNWVVTTSDVVFYENMSIGVWKSEHEPALGRTPTTPPTETSTATLPLLAEVGEPAVEDVKDVPFPSPSPAPCAPPLVADLRGLTPVSASGDEGRSGMSPSAPAKSIAGGRRDEQQVDVGVKSTLIGENQADEVQPTLEKLAKKASAGQQPTREQAVGKSAGKPAEVQQDDEGSEAGDDGGDAEESTDSDVVEVQRGPWQSGRIRRPLNFYIPAAFTMAYDEVDDDLQHEDAEEDEDFSELDPDMHADPEHCWDISTMTVNEALASWKGKAVKAAMEEEIRSLVGMGTWELFKRPPRVNIMKNRYVTLGIFLSIVVVLDLNLMQLDMKNAFLQSKLDRVLYMYQPDYFDDGTGQPLGAVSTMAGPEERGGRVSGGSGEAQAQGQPRDSAMAPVQPSLGPPRDGPRVFGLDKFNGENFAEWSFKMENIFDHYDLLEVMEGTEKRPENDPEKSPWVRKSAQGYLLLGQALGSSQIRHIKPFQREPEKGPKAWATLKSVHAPATAVVAVVLERQMAALRIEEDKAVEEGVQKFFDLLTRLEGADLNYSELQKKTKLLALLPESWSSLIINLNRDLPRLSLEDVKRAILQEDFRRLGDDEESDYDECAFVFFSPVEMPGEPATLKEALESSDAEEWKKAMESELKSIEENDTWELVELPEGRKAITPKCLFKIKSDADGKIERYKSRLVAKGYQKKVMVDYKELFAPVVKPTTLRTLLAGAAIKGWVVKQMDVTTAFLNGILEEEIFMVHPEGFDDGSGRVLKLKKALYGLKQAPRQWYLKLRGVLEEMGFTPSSADHSLFMLDEGEQRSFMVVYVDDILIFSPSSDFVKELMLKLQDKLKCKALGDCVKGPEEESDGEEERRRFHSLVGSLMYAAVNTRPDVAFATEQLARVVQCLNEEQVAAGMRVAKYLGQTPTVGLQYSAAAQRRQKDADDVELGRLFLTAFSDASFASEPEDMT
ncbi:unnamed protein product, partial [Closterium sp. NIES-53]